MNYRDNREALHLRIAKMEEDLKDARREGEEHGRDDAQQRAIALEQKLADMRTEMEKMGAELHALRGDKPVRGPLRLPVVFAVVSVAGLATTAFFFLRTPP